jgi:cytochrome c biogenesis protein CcmG, thiol:disulfide interchange protein DsbE
LPPLPSTPSSAPSDSPSGGASDSAQGPSRRARWILAGIAVVVVLAVGVVTWVVVAGSDDGNPSAAVVPDGVSTGGPRKGDPAPDFTLQTFDGEEVSLSDYAGTPVVLNFWASYCIPCREEFPLFREQLADDPGEFVVLGVDAKDIESDGRAFAKGQKATWPIAFDHDNDVAKAYGVGAVPQTFFIKPDGTVALRYYAGIPESKWPDAIATITSAKR